MGMQPPSRDMKTVPDLLMINFLFWLAGTYKNTYTRLQYLPIQTLMQLVHEFERSSLDVDCRDEAEWQRSVQLLFVSKGELGSYANVRRTYENLL